MSGKRDGAVEQVGAAVLAGPLGRAGDVEHVVEQLEREADAAPEAAQHVDRRGALQRAQLARRLEQARGLEVAAVLVALARDTHVPRVLALQQLSLGERGRRAGEHADRLRASVAGQLGERAREEQIAGGGGDRPPGGGHDGRPAATQVGTVEHVVVHERRRVDELDRHHRSQHALGPLGRRARREQHQQRPQPLAAGRDRGPRVLGQERPVRARQLLQALLELVHQLRNVRAARSDDRGHRLGARHQATVPECSAMIPPAVSTQRTSRRPIPCMTAPSSRGPGKRFTELGR